MRVRTALLVSVIALLTSCGSIPSRSAPTSGQAGPRFGTLASVARHSAEEARAGVSAATVELHWNQYEPVDGRFDQGYLRSVRAQLDALRSSGRTITLELSLHYTPGWLLATPGSRLVDDAGNVSNEANFVFNQRMRNAAEDYFAHAASGLGFGAVDEIRVNSGASAEVLYPGNGHFWAFDQNAQNGPDLPVSMPPNPAPGWRPGQGGLEETEAREWADWYVGALANTVSWQIEALSGLGFRGRYQVLTPAQGLSPSEYERTVREGLPPGPLGTGSAWQVLYDRLPRRPDIVAYVSSVADRPGDNDSCEPGDTSVPLDSPEVKNWSGTRWIARLAHEYGYALSGENPGYGFTAAPDLDPEYRAHLDAAYRDVSDSGMMADAIRQARTCGFQTFYWAHDERLWDGTVPFSAYAKRIATRN